MKNNWEYGSFYKKYEMNKEVEIGTGIVKTHDIFYPLPEFMYKADVIFSDPPCSQSNIRTFYTKADLVLPKIYLHFVKRFFECIKEINPKNVFFEVFLSNKDIFYEETKKLYPFVKIYDSYYYNNKNNKCWIIQGSYSDVNLEIDNINESNVIEYICKNIDYECIGDLCMGMGLVGWYSNKYNKPFVGTELNKKRLAVLIESINTNKKLIK